MPVGNYYFEPTFKLVKNKVIHLKSTVFGLLCCILHNFG
jgi:hypothetical protein